MGLLGPALQTTQNAAVWPASQPYSFAVISWKAIWATCGALTRTWKCWYEIYEVRKNWPCAPIRPVEPSPGCSVNAGDTLSIHVKGNTANPVSLSVYLSGKFHCLLPVWIYGQILGSCRWQLLDEGEISYFLNANPFLCRIIQTIVSTGCLKQAGTIIYSQFERKFFVVPSQRSCHHCSV